MKRIISFLLIAVMLLSAVPMAYAYVPGGNMCIAQHDGSEDYSGIECCAICDLCPVCDGECDCLAPVNYTSGTQVLFDAEDPDGDGVKDNVESYTVTVPAKLIPEENQNIGNVVAQGTWPSDRKLVVTADASVRLVNSLNADDYKDLDVTFAKFELLGNNTQSVSKTEPVSVELMPEDALFGIWSGIFEYQVTMADYVIVLPDKGKTAEEYTWDEISTIANAGKAAEYFTLGDTKTFTTTDGQDVVMEMVAFNADEQSTGAKAGITWISKNLVAYRGMNPNYGQESYGTRAYGWGGSELREWMQGEFFATLPTKLQQAIVPVNKVYSEPGTYEAIWVTDTVWIPSLYELKGDSSCNDKFGPTYADRFTTQESLIKTFEGTAYFWWSRSANVSGSTGNVAYFGWGEDGRQTYSSSHNGRASNGVVLCFCT